MQEKLEKLFSELFTNNIFEYSFVLFISNQILNEYGNLLRSCVSEI